MSKHTPGPLKFEHAYGRTYAIYTSQNYWIATVKGKENAALLADAPAMLAALKQLLACIDETRGQDATDAVAAAWALVKKHEGVKP